MSAPLVRETRALEHLRVVEVSRGVMAGHCGRLFADLGAQVQRIDASAGSLQEEPPFAGDPGSESLLAAHLTDGKQSLDLDPASAGFHEQLDAILKGTDILIEDSWPGTLFTGSSAPEALLARHAGLVVISLSPFGRTGPYKSWTGGELCTEAFGGFAYLTGQKEQPPLKLAGNVYAFTTAIQGFNGGLAALQARRRDGTGRVVDVSLAECVSSKQEWIMLYTTLGLISERGPAAMPFYYPHTSFACADGFIELGKSYLADEQGAMAAFLGDEEFAVDPRFATVMSSFLNHQAAGERIRAGIRDRTRSELCEQAVPLRILCAPVATPAEVPENSQLAAREFWKQRTLPSGRSFAAPGSPLRLCTHPEVRARRDAFRPRAAASQTLAEGPRPLEGVRVIDFTMAWAGPIATRVLAELGADVIHISSLQYLGRALQLCVWPENDPGDEPWNRQSYSLEKYLGKREVVLDVTQPRGRELLEELLAVSDIFVENHSPRALVKLGLTYAEIAEKFPHLIMASVSGYGQEGPWGPRPATGDLLETLAGITYCTGYAGGEPERAGNTIIDAVAGVTAAAALMAALEYRAEHGHGIYLDQSMLEAAVASFPEAALAGASGSAYPIRNGSRHLSRAPHDFYPCRGEDQWVAIDVDSERAWQGLARALDRPEWLRDARFASAQSRVAHREVLDPQLAELTSGWDKTDLAETLQRAGVSAAPALDLRELVLNPHLRERGLIEKIRHPEIGWRTWTRNFPGRISGFDLSIPRAAPLLGEHNEEVLGGLLGLSTAELEQLEKDGIIGRDPVSPPEVSALDPALFSEYPCIREQDPDSRARLGLDEEWKT